MSGTSGVDVCNTAYTNMCRKCPEHDTCHGADDEDYHNDDAICDCLGDKLVMINEMPKVIESMKKLTKDIFSEYHHSFIKYALHKDITVNENIEDPDQVPEELTTHPFYHILVMNKWVESFNAEPTPTPREE